MAVISPAALARRALRTDTKYQPDFPKLQIMTIARLLKGERPQMPWVSPDVFKRAKREMKGTQEKLL